MKEAYAYVRSSRRATCAGGLFRSASATSSLATASAWHRGLIKYTPLAPSNGLLFHLKEDHHDVDGAWGAVRGIEGWQPNSSARAQSTCSRLEPELTMSLRARHNRHRAAEPGQEWS